MNRLAKAETKIQQQKKGKCEYSFHINSDKVL
jgi:hypothetical protein